MRQSKIFYITCKESPKDEASRNAQLLIKGGFVDKLSAGVYTLLPLGLRVVVKIEEIIRQELLALGAQELSMPALHPKENWEITGRWETMTDLYKLKDGEKEMALGPTHEEVIVPLARQYVKSWRDLPLLDDNGNFPLSLFQFQTKFRKELRAKSGLLRTREFQMKDLYSFHRSEDDLNGFYLKVKETYLKIFSKLGIGEKIYYTYASGGTFSEFSHEFQLLTEAGEDTIYICEDCLSRGERIAINKEIIGKVDICPQCQSKKLKQAKGIEVANIFKLKNKFSAPFDLSYANQDGEKQNVLMGCYGMGVGRIMGSIVEASNDANGIIWPVAIAPFQIHLISLDEDSSAQKIYRDLQADGYEVLYDDRPESAGKKFIDADLIGAPVRIVVSHKTTQQSGVEVKQRKSKEVEIIPYEEIIKRMKDYADIK